MSNNYDNVQVYEVLAVGRVRRGRVVRRKGIGVVAIASRTYPTHVYHRLPDRILRATEAAAVTF